MQHLGNCLDVVRLEICAQCLLCDEFLWFMEPVVPWCHWFWHMSSKTGCCMGYYLGFIRLDKLHVHMSTSPGVKSITSVLPIYVEQLIVFCDLNPFRSSAAERKGRAVLLLYVLIWNLYCMLNLVLKSMFYDHFSLQLKYRQWQNSRKPTCPCDVPREQADQGWWCILPLYLILAFHPGNTGLVNTLLWNAVSERKKKKIQKNMDRLMSALWKVGLTNISMLPMEPQLS